MIKLSFLVIKKGYFHSTNFYMITFMMVIKMRGRLKMRINNFKLSKEVNDKVK